MKVALISDLHANLEAIQAVMEDIDRQGDVESIWCLGDIVGYGPDPEGVIDIVNERCEWVLIGNHDDALLNMPVGFNAIAAGAIACQRSTMEPGTLAIPAKVQRWEFLHDLPLEKKIGPDIFVHASPRDKIFEYILPSDPTRNPEKMEEIFALVERRCFVGHTHHPGVFLEGKGFYRPGDIGGSYTFKEGEKAIFNVSSAGQPRDHDPRAIYCTLTDESVTWHRVEYDVEATVAKVEANPCLDNLCGYRLREGR